MNRANHPSHPAGRRQHGAALVVGLILLLVLTVLAIASVGTSTMDLKMAANAQYAANAFQATERGIDVAILTTAPNTTTPLVTVNNQPAGPTDTYSYTMRFNINNGITEVPSGGFSLGEGIGFKAFHFDVTSTGSSSSNSTTTATQSFYVVGPSGS